MPGVVNGIIQPLRGERGERGQLYDSFFSSFFRPIYYILPFCFRSLLVVTQIRGHVVGFPLPPPPHYGVYRAFYRDKRLQPFSSLIDSRRIKWQACRRWPCIIHCSGKAPTPAAPASWFEPMLYVYSSHVDLTPFFTLFTHVLY